MTADATRVEVRTAAGSFVASTIAAVVAVGLGAGSWHVFGAWIIACGAAALGAKAALASHTTRGPAGPRARWVIVFMIAFWVAMTASQGWFPREGVFCGFEEGSYMIDDQVVVSCRNLVFVELPGNGARMLVLAFAVGMISWLVALILPLKRVRFLNRLEYTGSRESRDEIAPDQGADLALSALAVASVVAPSMGVMDELTWPLAWPAVQVAAAFVIILPLVKKRSIIGALWIYRITFVAYALFLARLATGTAPTLIPVERIAIGIAFLGVLVLAAYGHHRTGRLRDAGPPAAPQSVVA